MPLGSQWEYAETDVHVAEALKNPNSDARKALNVIISSGVGSGDIDGGTP